MPRYFFDLQDHESVTDDHGTEFESDDAAKVQAITFAGAYLRDHPELVWDGREIRIHVFDEAGEPVFLVTVLGVDLRRQTVPLPRIGVHLV